MKKLWYPDNARFYTIDSDTNAQYSSDFEFIMPKIKDHDLHFWIAPWNQIFFYEVACKAELNVFQSDSTIEESDDENLISNIQVFVDDELTEGKDSWEYLDYKAEEIVMVVTAKNGKSIKFNLPYYTFFCDVESLWAVQFDDVPIIYTDKNQLDEKALEVFKNAIFQPADDCEQDSWATQEFEFEEGLGDRFLTIREGVLMASLKIVERELGKTQHKIPGEITWETNTDDHTIVINIQDE